MTRSCGTCMWWVAPTSNSSTARGQCRRYPPGGERLHGAVGGWPRTLASEWCGEHNAKNEEKQLRVGDEVIVEIDAALYDVCVMGFSSSSEEEEVRIWVEGEGVPRRSVHDKDIMRKKYP